MDQLLQQFTRLAVNVYQDAMRKCEQSSPGVTARVEGLLASGMATGELVFVAPDFSLRFVLNHLDGQEEEVFAMTPVGKVVPLARKH